MAEIRRRLAGARVSVRALRSLQGDPRAGVRALGASLAREKERARSERRRLRTLFRPERESRARGFRRVAGVDEVGMGPLAGPVVAVAVILPERVEIEGLDDSKRLTPAARTRLDLEIRLVALDLSIAWALPDEIDRINIYQAGLLAMRRAVEALSGGADYLLVDGRTVPEVGVAQQAISGGDRRSGSIAAASIVAKVYRDGWMQRLDRRYPGYGFARNAGYPTELHRRALLERGPTPVHRRSFAPVRSAAQRAERS